MNVKKRNIIGLMVLILGTISGCYPVDDLLVEDLDVAATLYDKAYYSPESGTNGFNELLTFEVVDTIIHVVAPGDDDNISRNYDEYVLEQLRLNLLKLGFVEEPNPDLNPPDVAVTVTALMSEHEVYYWYPYWGWYWGYYPYSYMRSGTDFEATTKSTTDTYYYYYPWYPYSTYYTYQSGTVLMEMVDVARIDPDVEKIPVIWAGIVNGVMESSQTPMKERISKGIDQCFEQSPYLIKTLDN